MKKQITKILTPLILLQTLFFQVDLLELVLCFGDDGHIAIEQARASNCDFDQNKVIRTNKISQALNPLHDNCTDIELDWHFSSADVIKKGNKTLKNNSNLFVSFSLLQFTGASTNNSNNVITHRNKHTLASINTTVLLI